MPQKNMVNMGFAPEPYPEGTHMCLIFSNEIDRRRTMMQFIASGLSDGERISYFSDIAKPEEVLDWLKASGINSIQQSNGDQIDITSTSDVYYPGGNFIPEEMLEKIRKFYLKSKESGYRSCRVSGEMSWALKNVPGSERLIEYEAQVNTVLIDYPVTAVCQYDLNKFNADTIVDCLKVHPYLIVHGQIIQNPYYMSAEEYLREKNRNE